MTPRAGTGPGNRTRHAHPAIERSPELLEAVDEASAIQDMRDRAHGVVAIPDRMSGFLTGGTFILALAAWLVLYPPASWPLLTLVVCIAAESLAGSIEFELGPGVALPTIPVLVVSLFVLPPQLVPVVAVSGLFIASMIVRRVRDPERHERVLVLAGSAWHSMGPSLVFAAAGVGAPAVAGIPIYVAALGAQYSFDFAASWIRNCYGLGVPTNKLLNGLKFAFLADLLLAPIGLAAAFAAPGSVAAFLFLVGPMLLLAILERDRARQNSRAVVLSEAFAQSADRARRDALTGLRNRLAWEEAISHHSEGPGPVGIVLADVDGLKATNDIFGHEAGDRLLVAVADVMTAVTPAESGAMVARLGGDEFGILLPGHISAAAPAIVEQLHAAMGASMPNVHGPVTSASVGFGIARTGSSLSAAFLEADRALYEDKALRGRHRR